ncbi:MAG: NAD(P)H-dependent glycerol-3-phosphate dehydrogenase [Pseudomonadales bacterium]
MSGNAKIAVLGGGSFGTVIANILAGNGFDTTLWLRNADDAEEINTQHFNTRYLPEFPLHESLKASTDLRESVSSCGVVFMAVPSSSSRQVANTMKEWVAAGTLVVSMTKGIEAGSYKLMSQVLAEELPLAKIAVMSGPNLAREIAAGQMTGTVIASADTEVQQIVQNLLKSPNFRVYVNPDVFGVELGGALKNIYAIVSGIGAAMEMGQNTIGMLLTRSLAEMSRFAVRMGANPMTFLGLSGVGDLIVTCMSPLSRNYQLGYQIGLGKPLDKILEELGQVAEGLNTLQMVKQMADDKEVYMPLVSGLHAILIEQRDVGEVISSLMGGEQTSDVEFLQANDVIAENTEEGSLDVD